MLTIVELCGLWAVLDTNGDLWQVYANLDMAVGCVSRWLRGH
jgi:hypothetical protein